MDPAARVPIERLLEHRAWVRSLARALVNDAGRADDVEQDAWLAAMTHPPRHDAGLKTWLARLVRHRASNARRAETRRAIHERDAVPSPRDVDPTDAVARIEELERVVRAVLELDEPYRSTIVLRFYEDLDAHAIAARTGAPVETVRTRLKRALAQLRGRLDDEHGGDGRAWCAALLPLAAGADGALAKGGLVVTAKAKASLAVAAVALVALMITFVALGGRDAPPHVETAAAPPPPAPTVVAEETPAPPPAPAPVPTKPVVAPAPVAVAPPVEKPPAPKPKPARVVVAEPLGTGAVFGAVRYAATRAPVAGQKVALEAVGASTLTVSTDVSGRFRFEHLAEGRAWRVRVEADKYATVVVPNLRLDRDETRDVGTLWLEAPLSLDVVVKDWRDRPIAGATVEAYRKNLVGVSDAFSQAVDSRYLVEAAAGATTGADGRGVLSKFPHGEWLVVARADGFAGAFLWSVIVGPGATKREVTLHLDKASRIEGRVVDGDRRPVARASVWAHDGTAVATGSLAFPHAVSDDAGRFVLDGLRAGETTLRIGREGATPCAIEKVRVPSSGTVEIVLDGGIVEGVVTDASDGKPLAGARVLTYMLDTKAATMAEATTGEDGRYRLDIVRAGRPWSFRVERQGFVTVNETTPNVMSRAEISFKGEPTKRDFALRRGVPVSGRVVGPDGPVAGAQVVANWRNRIESSGSWLVRSEGFTDGDGRFSLTAAANTTVIVQAFADGLYQDGLADFEWSTAQIHGRKPPHSIDVPPRGLPDVTITMTRACAVSGRVESATGAPVAGASIRCVWSTTTTADDGTFSLTAAVTGGASQISAWDGQGSDIQPIALTPAGRVDDVVLRLPRKVRVSGRVTAAGGAAVDGASVEVIFRPTKPEMGQREWPAARVPVVDGGRYEAEFVEKEGGFHVRASAPGFASAESPQQTIESGRATYQADLVLAPSLSLEGRVVSSADGTAPVVGARVALLVGSAAEFDHRPRTIAAMTDDDGRFRVPDVAAGDVEVDVDAEGFVQMTTHVQLPTLPGLVLKVDPSSEIAGVVKLPGDATVADVWDGGGSSGVSVLLRLEHDRQQVRSWSTHVDADGRFRLSRLPRGTYTAFVIVHGGTVSVARFEQSGVPSGATDLELVLKPASEIAGRVLAPDGRPLGGCSVQAYSESGDPYTPSDTTKNDGTFVVRGLGAGTFRLEARPPEAERTGYVTQGAQLRAAKATGVASGAKDVEIRLTGGLSIRGVFLDAAGKPLADAWLRAVARPGQDLAPGEDGWLHGPGAQTDSTGRFTISGLATAHYRVVQVPDPQLGIVVRPLQGGDDVAAGATNVRVAAGNLSTITGTVVDADGKPAADIQVDVMNVGGGYAAIAHTDADGAFKIRDMSDVGRYVVKASKPGRVAAQVEDVAAGAAGLKLVLRTTE
jgi:RNA polymerase sigma-70 factor (ECF subfamily)